MGGKDLGKGGWEMGWGVATWSSFRAVCGLTFKVYDLKSTKHLFPRCRVFFLWVCWKGK